MIASPPKIVIGLYAGRSCMSCFVPNVARIVERLVRQDLYGGIMQRQSSRIDSNRNFLIADFLEKFPDATHLFIMDDDMLHPAVMPEILLRRNKPMITGLYFRRDYSGNYCPVIYKAAGRTQDTRRGHGKAENDGFRPMTPEVMDFFARGGAPDHDREYRYLTQNLEPLEEDKALLRIDASGFGCLLLSREVLEQMDAPYLLDEAGLNGDLVFFRNAMRRGIEHWADLSVIAAHNTDDAWIGIHRFNEYCHQIDRMMRDAFPGRYEEPQADASLAAALA